MHILCIERKAILTWEAKEACASEMNEYTFPLSKEWELEENEETEYLTSPAQAKHWIGKKGDAYV